tara:strand:+ start:97 stop:303 length:207 start_codon:yes stop_codon:yes gene_type:complete
MNKSQQTQNEIFFKKMISLLNEGGTYVWQDRLAFFTMTNGKLVAPDAQTLKAVRKIVSKKAGLKLFTI